MATGGALGSLPAETFLFQALLKLQDEFHVPVEEIQNSIQSSYSMLAEFNKVNAYYYYDCLLHSFFRAGTYLRLGRGTQMRGTGDMCTGCGNMHPEAEPLTFEAMQNWEAPGFPWADKVDHVLKTVFNHEQFRPNQRKVINCVLSGRDAFVIMPTGAGKSLLYQLPGVISNGFTLVISPLLSLIQDQVSALRKKGVVAVELSSSRTPKEVSQMLKKRHWYTNAALAKDTNVKFLFVTPERVVKSTRFFAFLRQQVDQARLARVVIDECHCISQWGYDFRPDFKQLLVLRKEFPNVPILALTSSATNRCKVDTMRQLGLEECDFFTQSFNRPNLRYAVENKTKKTTKKIIQFIKKKHNSESGIIYCLSKKECEAMARKLQAAKIQANFYHAGLSPAKREKVQRKWMAGEFAVMVATIAFGLGIDKADVRFVIHHSLPRTIEDFYQESGRAGRDGLNADCVVFYRHSDRPRHTFMQLSSCKNAFQARTKLEKMRQLTAWCEDHTRCRRELLLEYFGEAFTGGACCNGMCDNCLFGARAVALDWCRQAQAVVRIVGSLGDKATMANVVSVVRGCTTPTVKANGWHSLPDFGADTSASELACRRLVQWMTLNNFLLWWYRSLNNAH
ncbi:ATPdependent DNA helicase, RecQ subfamily protein [Acanthamoeba castellanii str. Neff]|uniref:ATP-dependent DNA helicase n=1 Tax=Acanthamoeba castellanii (strain ATCC 30010 / Neff) TaxID=1257118 RepID=L8GS10_ACACF|nr:ATPdependent DNA helicase, RecQ subfamily protein [Acanthamoeba castellanii str. Neff]ELR15702.1 ATPdependent DNA helicase, RecQ subfamily protein [Acanthamoeba castellanii str. Neff]